MIIHIDGVTLEGQLTVPEGAAGIVLFAHGSGSSRHSPRNRAVARFLNDQRIGTLLFDLLTTEEEKVDQYNRELRFDIDLLAARLNGVAEWVVSHDETAPLKLGYFGASTGAAAALTAAGRYDQQIYAIVSRGGRPDLTRSDFSRITAPTLLIVGALDKPVIEMNQSAMKRLQCETQLEIIPGASHLFEEPGALNEVAHLAADWFHKHFTERTT